MLKMQVLEKEARPVLAVDIGGTKIITAIITADGQVLAEACQPTLAGEGVPAVIGRLFSAIDNLLQQNSLKTSHLRGISLAVAGPIDSKRGIVTVSPNMPDWHDVPLREMIRQRYEGETFLVNDASAAALGEHRFGAGRGINDLVLLTLGTGIGGGIIIDGRLYGGAGGAAGEIGHMVIDVNGPACGCGRRGCLEALASGTAVARETIKRLRQGEKSSLAAMVGGRLEDITAEKVGEAARQGDGLAQDVLSRAAKYLGVGMANLINIFNPQMIILGGGMANIGAPLLDPARQVALAQAFPIAAGAVSIVTAELGEAAGIYGAAAFAFGNDRR